MLHRNRCEVISVLLLCIDWKNADEILQPSCKDEGVMCIIKLNDRNIENETK